MFSVESSVDLARRHAARDHDTRPGQSDRIERGVLRSLVFVAPPGTIPHCVVDAVEREFPSLRVELLSNIEDIGVVFEQPVALFLVDSAFLPQLDENMRRHRHLHRQATAAVVFEDMASAAAHYTLIRDCDFARGILPMNLKLDVWLSVVKLLLCGGEYLPTSLLRDHAQNSHIFSSSSPRIADAIAAVQPKVGGKEEEMLGELTEREFEVLELVARGTQNKLIASELGLSEHTVKIHIHNIIRKLRVHNRTEAAAFFLQSSMAGDRNGNGGV
jgi:DNA-binding NarL/FixJ family response regulator